MGTTTLEIYGTPARPGPKQNHCYQIRTSHSQLNWDMSMQLSVGGVRVERQLWGGQFGSDYNSGQCIWSLAQ